MKDFFRLIYSFLLTIYCILLGNFFRFQMRYTAHRSISHQSRCINKQISTLIRQILARQLFHAAAFLPYVFLTKRHTWQLVSSLESFVTDRLIT